MVTTEAELARGEAGPWVRVATSSRDSLRGLVSLVCSPGARCSIRRAVITTPGWATRVPRPTARPPCPGPSGQQRRRR